MRFHFKLVIVNIKKFNGIVDDIVNEILIFNIPIYSVIKEEKLIKYYCHQGSSRSSDQVIFLQKKRLSSFLSLKMSRAVADPHIQPVILPHPATVAYHKLFFLWLLFILQISSRWSFCQVKIALKNFENYEKYFSSQ